MATDIPALPAPARPQVDRRLLVTAVLAGLIAGVAAGIALANKLNPEPYPIPLAPSPPKPCAGCEERRRLEEEDKAEEATTVAVDQPVEATPGDSSVPED